MKIQSSKGGNMDTYQSYSTYSSSSDLSPAVSAGLLIGYLVFLLVIYVVFSYFMGKLFKKAGEESWKAWVPVYNQWVFLQLGGQQGFWAILAFVPIINIVSVVITCIAAYQIGLNLQKEGWFILLYIFLSPVWIIWLALDSSTWKGVAAPAAASAATPTPPPYQPSAPGALVEQPQTPQPPVSQPPVTEEPGPNQTPTPPTPPASF
jgi:hypothetical protein